MYCLNINTNLLLLRQVIYIFQCIQYYWSYTIILLPYYFVDINKMQ